MKSGKKRTTTISISKENYESVKTCAKTMDLSMGEVIDRILSNKIPGDGDIGQAEFMMIDALTIATVNLDENDCKRLLESLIGIFAVYKDTNLFMSGKNNRFDILYKYFRIREK